MLSSDAAAGEDRRGCGAYGKPGGQEKNTEGQ